MMRPRAWQTRWRLQAPRRANARGLVLRGPSRSGQSAELRVGVFLDPVHAAAESLRPSHPIAVGESHVCAVVEEPTLDLHE